MAVRLGDELPGGRTAESNRDLRVFPLIRTLRHQHFPHNTDPGASFLIAHRTPFYGWALLSFHPPLRNTGFFPFFLSEGENSRLTENRFQLLFLCITTCFLSFPGKAVSASP